MGKPLEDAAKVLVADECASDPRMKMPKHNHTQVYKGKFMELIELASRRDQTLLPIVQAWKSISGGPRLKFTIDDIVFSCGLDPAKVIGAASAMAYEIGFSTSSLMAMNNLPRVISASIDSATQDGRWGAKDREMLMRHATFIPVPQGQTINIQNIASVRPPHGVESFEETMKRTDAIVEGEIIQDR